MVPAVAILATLYGPLFFEWEPVFRQRLREWGLDSGEPIGTLILAGSPEELAWMIRTHPASDFLLPQPYRAAVEPTARQSETLRHAGEPKGQAEVCPTYHKDYLWTNPLAFARLAG